MIEERIKVVDSQGNERTWHDEARGIGKGFEDFSALAGGAAYPATKLDFILPDTTTFGTGVLVRDSDNQYVHLRTIHMNNKEADSRTVLFYDGDPGGVAGTFKQLITTITVLAGCIEVLTEEMLKGFMLAFDLYFDVSGTKTSGFEVAASALVVNKENIE